MTGACRSRPDDAMTDPLQVLFDRLDCGEQRSGAHPVSSEEGAMSDETASHVRYIDKTRAYYQAEGYGKPYEHPRGHEAVAGAQGEVSCPEGDGEDLNNGLREVPMKKVLAVILAAAVLPAFVPAARAQNLDDIFRKVKASVAVVRSKGRDVKAGGVTRFNETGSGVLISESGRVMTAAHVVNGMDGQHRREGDCPGRRHHPLGRGHPRCV